MRMKSRVIPAYLRKKWVARKKGSRQRKPPIPGESDMLEKT